MTEPARDDRLVAKVLLVDDRADNLIALAAVMENLDVEVVQARSGLQALDAMLKHDFAVVLLDVGMPGMDGFDTAAMIKQHPRCGKVPIIFVTASIGYLEHSTRGYEVGAADYLPSPSSRMWYAPRCPYL